MNESPSQTKPGVAPDGGTTLDDRRTVYGVCFLLAAITLVVFSRTLGYSFIGYDDGTYIYQNHAVTSGLTWAGIARAFTYGSVALWDPLTTLSHMADCQLYGLHAGGHHLTNVLLHTASVVLLFLVLRKMTGALWPSAFAAAVFAIHPLRVESVAWITERKDVLSGLFFMLTLWAYARYASGPPKLSRYLMVVLWFVLGLMSKVMLVTLPLVLLLLDYWPLQRFDDFKTKEKSIGVKLRSPVLLEKIPLLAIALIFCALGIIFQQRDHAIRSVGTYPVSLRLANAVVSLGTYLWQMIYPARLAVMYPFPLDGIAVWKVAVSTAILAGISMAAFCGRRARPWLLAGWLWYLVMLLPVIGLVQVGKQAHADRYTYLPQIGLYVALAWTAGSLWSRWRLPRAVLGGMAGAVIAVLGVSAFNQTAYWGDTELLWRHALASAPDNSVARGNLGIALLAKGRDDEAMAEFQRATRVGPPSAEAQNNLGSALANRGRVDEAISRFRKSMEIDPYYVLAYNNLSRALRQKGQLDEAFHEAEEAIRLKPDFADAHLNLGNLYSQQGKVSEAMAQFQQAIEIQPDLVDARYNLGTLFYRQGRVDDAIAQFRAALAVRPDFAKARQDLEVVAWDLATSPNKAMRNGAEALELAQQLTSTSSGNNPEELTTLAAAYAETGQFADATATAARARQLALAQTNAPLADAIQEQLAVYQAGHPFRDTAATNAPGK